MKLISRKKCAKILSHRCQAMILHVPRDEKKSQVAKAATQDFFSSLVLAILIFQRLGVMQHYNETFLLIIFLQNCQVNVFYLH